LLRNLALLVIGASLALLAVNYRQLWEGLFSQQVPPEIVAEAKKRVPPPVMPPAPAGRTEIDGYDDKYAEVQIPEIQGFPPRVTMRSVKTLISRVPRTRVIAPPSDAIEAWQAEVARLNAQYEAALRSEIDAIQSRRNKELREVIQSWVAIVGGSVGAIVGLVTVAFTVRRDRRDAANSARKQPKRRGTETSAELRVQPTAPAASRLTASVGRHKDADRDE
jgi:hypothetical protein